MSSSGKESKGRRWGRKTKRDTVDEPKDSGYIPPALEGQDNDDYYMASPPKSASSGLTGNITSLFRRASSRERGSQERTSQSKTPTALSSPRRTTEDPHSPSATAPRTPQRAAQSVASEGSRQRVLNLYSSTADDDSEDSFESRVREKKIQPPSSTYGMRNPMASVAAELLYDGASSTDQASEGTGTYSGTDGTFRTILRYRGFSTSIQNLFLDESLVCASMGCFGLILSNRTEYLLQLRNDRRGVRWGRSTSRRTLPSRIVAYALLVTILLIATTFVVWGFGNGKSSVFAEGWYEGYDYVDDAYNVAVQDDDIADNQNFYYDDDGIDNTAEDDALNYYNADDNVNNYNNNDDGNNDDGNNDDGNNGDDNYNGDDANNDDGNNGDDNYNGYNGDDANDDANGDDAYVAANDDANDDAANGDDANNGDDAYNAQYNNGDDDYYAAGDDDGRLLLSSQMNHQHSSTHVDQCPHAINGIFKIRDMHEGLWEPAIDFLKDEWYRGQPPPTHDRSLEYDEGTAQTEPLDLASNIRIVLIIVFLIVLGILGRRRRMRTRYYLVRARAQEDHLFYASSVAGVKRVAFQDSREDQYEGACSHTLCGCYPTDPPMEGDEIEDEVKVDDDGVKQQQKKRHHHDCISRGFSCLMATCCGVICRCWFQCMSVCALAQEAREIRLLVPTRYQRIDYITHQPFHEYQKNVNDLRRGWLGKTRKKSGIMPHLQALSRLSRYILAMFIASVTVIIATLVFNPRASFSWPDAVILIATFVQSFIVLFLVHWIFHKSDLSLDAVIKFFAAGFLIAVPASFFFEGILVNITISIPYMIYGIADMFSKLEFLEKFVGNFRVILIVSELINAYVVAAVTEELCKYYTFRGVEHPDLIFLTGLARSSQDERSVAGGMVKYPFGAHQVQATNKKADYDDDDRSVSSRSSHRSTRSSRSRSNASQRESVLDLDQMPTEEEYYEDEHDVRTHRQKAAAVTTGMISVAVGLACAENFLYVFLLGGAAGNSGDVHSGGVIEEWIVLLFRSLFPVHALAAAMQSINMIRKFVECEDDNTHRVGVGRIILPAVIMHGSFDAVLLLINVYIETAWNNYLRDNEGNFDPNRPPYNPVIVNLVAWLSIIAIMMGGTLWYLRENRAQRSRLIVLEEKEKSVVDDYQNPEATPAPTEIV